MTHKFKLSQYIIIEFIMMMLRNSILLIVCFLELSSSFYHIHGIRSRIGVWKRLLSTRSSSSSYEKTTTSKSSSSTQSLAKVTKKIAASVYGRNQSRTKLESSVGLSVHSEICSQLSGNARQNVPALKAFLVENDSYLLFVNGHALMQRCARAKIPIESVIALPRLLEVLKYRAPSEYTTFQISSFLYGLRSLFITSTVLTKDKLDILNFGNEILLKHDNRSMFTAQEVSNSFYGLQYLNADNPTTCLLISRMVDVMKSSTPNFSCHEISNSLYGK